MHKGHTRGYSRGVGCSRFGDAAARHSVEGAIEKASAAAVDRKCVSAAHGSHGSCVGLCVCVFVCLKVVVRCARWPFVRLFVCLLVCLLVCLCVRLLLAACCPELVVGLVRERALCGAAIAGS